MKIKTSATTLRLFGYFLVVSVIYFSLALTGGTIWNKNFAWASGGQPPAVMYMDPHITRNTVVLNVNIFGYYLDHPVVLQLTQNWRVIAAGNVQVLSPNQINCDFDFIGVSPGRYDLMIETENGQFVCDNCMLVKGHGNSGDDDTVIDDDTILDDDTQFDDDTEPADDDTQASDDDVADDDDGADCTRGQGYWKTHSTYGPAPYDDTWALLPQGADTAFYLSGQSYYQVLHTPPEGNGYYILAHQYIATQLNQLQGASIPDEALAAYLQASGLFQTYAPEAVEGPLREQFVSLAPIMDDYNNGIIEPGACDAADDDMADDDATPSDDDATPADDDVAPDDDATPPADDDAVPDDDVIPPVDDDVVPDDDVTPPDDDDTTTDDDAATDDDVTPSDDDAEPDDDDTMPPDDDVPPDDDPSDDDDDDSSSVGDNGGNDEESSGCGC